MLRTLLVCLMLAISSPAFAIYKCEADGKTIYTEAPCLEGKSTDLSDKIKNDPTAYDAAQARRKAEQEKREATQLDREHKLREQLDEKARQQADRALAAKRQKCERLAQREDLPLLDPKTASGNSGDGAERDSQRRTEKVFADCMKR
jgi:Skp family chaperone for outer membrane proteins